MISVFVYIFRVCKNRLLRRMSGPKREEEVVGGWRRLHNEGLHNLYVSSNIISVVKSRRMRWKGHVARMREMINANKILVGKQRKRPLGRPKYR
jgi:hypothetical protein